MMPWADLRPKRGIENVALAPGGVDGSKQGDPPPRADQEAKETVRHGRADQRHKKESADPPGPRVAQPSPSPFAPKVEAFGRWSMNAPGAKVKLVVDGAPYQDPPFKGALLPVGKHDLVILDGDTSGVLSVQSFTVVADQVVKITYKPEPP